LEELKDVVVEKGGWVCNKEISEVGFVKPTSSLGNMEAVMKEFQQENNERVSVREGFTA
jgi:hypothetical protein